MLNLLHTTNDGRCILEDSVKNNGHLSDDAQKLSTLDKPYFTRPSKVGYYV